MSKTGFMGLRQGQGGLALWQARPAGRQRIVELADGLRALSGRE